MSWKTVARRPEKARQLGIFAWTLTVLLVLMIAAIPHAAASPLQLHGALQRDAGVGIISHRGAAAIAPENTIAAIRAAIDQGVDFVEIDVQLTADGVPILMHDPTLERTTDGAGDVTALTLPQVRELDAGSWFADDFAGEPVPTLEEALNEVAPTGARMFIELKEAWTEAQLDAVVALVHAHGLDTRVVLQSFDLTTLEKLESVAPELATVMLTREVSEEVLQTAVQLQVSGIGARAELFDEVPGFVERARAVGIGVTVYTLNSEEEWIEAHKRGVDLIVTDDPIALATWRDAESIV